MGTRGRDLPATQLPSTTITLRVREIPRLPPLAAPSIVQTSRAFSVRSRGAYVMQGARPRGQQLHNGVLIACARHLFDISRELDKQTVLCSDGRLSSLRECRDCSSAAAPSSECISLSFTYCIVSENCRPMFSHLTAPRSGFVTEE